MALLRETGVASVAGSAFYHGGDGEYLIRFCFAKNDKDLEEACRRLRAGLQRPEPKRGTPIAATK
jgi:aminotransferase